MISNLLNGFDETHLFPKTRVFFLNFVILKKMVNFSKRLAKLVKYILEK